MATDRGNIVPFRTLQKYATKEAEARALPVDAFAQQYGIDQLVEPSYSLDTLMGLLEVNTWHHRCCEVKANDVAGLGFDLQPAQGHVVEGPDADPVRAFFFDEARHGKPVGRILTDVEQDFQATGCLAIEIVREMYDPVGLPYLMAHVPVNTVRPHSSGVKYCQIRGANRIWFKKFGYDRDVDYTTGKEYPLGSLDPNLRATELIWDRAFSGRSDYYGTPAIIPALGAVEAMRASRNYNLSFFKNYGIPSYAIYISGDYNLGTPVRIKLEDDGSGTLGQAWDPNQGWTRTYFEYPLITNLKNHMAKIAENPHAPMILAVPSQSAESKVQVEIKPLNVEVKDSSFRMLRRDDRDEILLAHGVPGYRIGLVETGSLGGNVAVESTRIYRDSVINPRKTALASLLNVFVVKSGFQATSVVFYFFDLDLAEEEHEKDVAKFLFDNGAMTPAELRKTFGGKFGLTPVDNVPALDAFYINGQPISGGGDLTTAVKGLRDRLMEIADGD